MEKQMESANITDNLLNVFNYSFVETAPYSFFVPKKDKYTAVNLVDKIYHCLHCQETVTVKYHHTGVTYFSKERFDKQKTIYEDLQLTFPTAAEIEAEQEFTYHVRGFCPKCAKKELAAATEPEQAIYNYCFALHKKDENLLVTARTCMGEAVKKWLSGITDSAQLTQYDLSTYEALRDLICSTILADTAALSELLSEYRRELEETLMAAEAMFGELPEKWATYTARPTAVYESMSDELYHEYTIVFPEKTTKPQDFFIFRTIAKDRVRMFLQQPRIATLEQLLLETGFEACWVDWLVDHVMALKK